MSLLNEMGDLLQCCANTIEARSVVSRLCRKLFAEAASGMLFEFSASPNVVEATAFWGDSHISESAFAPQACWAVRGGRPHWSKPASDAILCAHFASPDAVAVLCVPMMAQSEVVGVLHLQHGLACAAGKAGDQESFHKSQETLASAVAGQIALAFASLRLRETLREQSIRDPLTGLFNRRIMQESLNRELHRARRKQHPVTVALIDLDHFKRFNGTWGHDAGDLVLKTMAQIFRRHFRAEEVICRYGGEEFSIILPEASVEDAAKRANVLRDEVRKLTIRYLDHNLDPVKLSIGLATFPQHGSTAEQLLRIADQCLYQSKAASVESRRPRPRHHAPCKRGCHRTRGFGYRITELESAPSNCLSHTHDSKRCAIGKRHFNALYLDIASRLIQRNSGKRGTHLESLESCGHGGMLADLKNLAADSASSPFWMDEEGADLGRIFSRIKKLIFTPWPMIAAEQGLAFAPAATADQHGVVIQDGFGNEIRSIGNELCIHAEQCAQRTLKLVTCVTPRHQSTDGSLDECV